MRTISLKKNLVTFGVALSLALVAVTPFAANAQEVWDNNGQPSQMAPFQVSESRISQSGASGGSSTGCDNLKDRGLNGVVGCIVGIFNTLIYLMMSASVVYVVYGAFIMIGNEEKRDDGKKIIYHGIIGLFVMISIWGLVNILDSTFKLSGVRSGDVIPRGGGFISPP